MTVTLEEAIEAADRNARDAMAVREERDVLRKQLDRYTVDLLAVKARLNGETLFLSPMDVEFISRG